jgi:hypothetical protein
MERFAIKHTPTGKFLHSDEGGTVLLDEQEGFFTWGRKSDVDEVLSYYDEDECIYDELTGNEYSISEFEVAEV